MLYGDENGDRGTAPILFGGSGGPPPPTTTPGPTTTTTIGAPTTSAISQAYQTLFDFADPSVADKVAVIQNGASIETALSQALSSSLGSSATGANVHEISLLDNATCAQDNLPSPCAQVTYDILGQGGTAILPNNQGYAVSVDGTWLVATTTVCNLLDLFYQAAGMTGSPPGCAATTGASTPTPVPGSGQVAASTTSPTSTATAPTTDPAQPSDPTTEAGSPTTNAPATRATSSMDDPTESNPISPATPVVRAASSSLAFTGLGATTQWIVVAGSALIVLGFAMLMLGDVPRRIRWALAKGAGVVEPPTATDH